MTTMIFWTDPYLSELATSVTAVDGDIVMLKETILFAFRGGQERDHGTIAGLDVLDAAWKDEAIEYRLAPHHGLRAGDPVTVAIDATRRDRLRRLHMATEIVLVLVTRDQPHLLKVGAHIAATKGRIDFAADSVITNLLPAVAAAANHLIASDLSIERGLAGQSDRRFWEIEGFARLDCGGTLPARTGEIGPIELRRTNPGKGKERVEITLASP